MGTLLFCEGCHASRRTTFSNATPAATTSNGKTILDWFQQPTTVNGKAVALYIKRLEYYWLTLVCLVSLCFVCLWC